MIVTNRALAILNSTYEKNIETLVFPVTVASGENALSTLTLIKNRFGSSVSQDRLSSLMILQLSLSS